MYVLPHKSMTDLDDMCVPQKVLLNGTTGLDLDWRIWYDRMRRQRPRKYTSVQIRLSPVRPGWIQTGASDMTAWDDYGQGETLVSKDVSRR